MSLENGRNGKCPSFARLKSFAYLCSEHWEGCFVKCTRGCRPLVIYKPSKTMYYGLFFKQA